jgi:hypothetical protein
MRSNRPDEERRKMAEIQAHEVVGLVKADYEYHHGWEMAVVRVLGIPVLYASVDDVPEHQLEDATDEVREALGAVLGRLLMTEGVPGHWQTKPVSPEPPF